MEHKFSVSTVRNLVSAPYDLPEDASYDISNDTLLYQTNISVNAEWLCSVLNGDNTNTTTFVSKDCFITQSPREFMSDRDGSFLCFVEAEGTDDVFFVCTSRYEGTWLLEKLNNHLTSVGADTSCSTTGR
jgi:hypothetical protein